MGRKLSGTDETGVVLYRAKGARLRFKLESGGVDAGKG